MKVRREAMDNYIEIWSAENISYRYFEDLENCWESVCGGHTF